MPQKRLYIPQTLKLSYLAHFKSTPESQDQKALPALPVLMAQCLSKTLPRNRRNLYEDHRASKANPACPDCKAHKVSREFLEKRETLENRGRKETKGIREIRETKAIREQPAPKARKEKKVKLVLLALRVTQDLWQSRKSRSLLLLPVGHL